MKMRTFKGHWIDLDKQEVSCVDIEDIAHSLAFQNRFNGHTVRPYSVAQHCILVSHVVVPPFALWGLLHDAAEAYTGDIIRPIKAYMPEFHQLEQRLLVQVADAFGLPTLVPWQVAKADNRMLVTEIHSANVYNYPDVEPAGALDAKPYPGLIIEPYKTTGEAKRKFLHRFGQLYEEKKSG